MMLLTAGVSHKTAPLAVRERLAVQDSELVAVARSLKSHLGLDDLWALKAVLNGRGDEVIDLAVSYLIR